MIGIGFSMMTGLFAGLYPALIPVIIPAGKGIEGNVQGWKARIVAEKGFW